MKRNQEYDPFAWLYTTYWGEEFHKQSLAVLDRLILRRLPRRAAVLDLCCGDGRLSHQLIRRGFAVIGEEDLFERRRRPIGQIPRP